MKITVKIIDNYHIKKYEAKFLHDAVNEFNSKDKKFVLKPKANPNFIRLKDVIGNVEKISYDNAEYVADIDLYDTKEGLFVQELVYNNAIKFYPNIFIKTKNRIPEKYVIQSVSIVTNYDFVDDDISSYDDSNDYGDENSINDSSVNDNNSIDIINSFEDV